MTPLLLTLAAGLIAVAPVTSPLLAPQSVPLDRAAPPIAQPAPKPAPSPAPPPVAAITAEIVILHGTNDNTGIDPRIGKIAPLTKPPFSSFNSYKLLDSAKLPIPKAKSASHKLPTGRDLLLAFKDVVQPQKQGDPVRYLVAASILEPGGKPFLPNIDVNAKAGEWFFLGGQEYKGGNLFIGIKVTP